MCAGSQTLVPHTGIGNFINRKKGLEKQKLDGQLSRVAETVIIGKGKSIIPIL